MDGFRRTAKEHDAEIVFLTRPHREPTAYLRHIENNWRWRVPEYNDALRRFGEDSGSLVIDVQRVFETQYPEGFIDECHFTEEGHRRTAEFLAGRLPSLLPRSPEAL